MDSHRLTSFLHLNKSQTISTVVDVSSHSFDINISENSERMQILRSSPLGKKVYHYSNFSLKQKTEIKVNQIFWNEEQPKIHYDIRQMTFRKQDENLVEWSVSQALDMDLSDVIPKMDHSTMDSLNDVVLMSESEPITSPGPRVIYVNKAFTKMTGYEPDEIIGKTPRILHGEKTEAQSRDKIREGLKKWSPLLCELTNYRKDGTPFLVELNISPVADSTGWYTHWVSIQRDITQRNEEDVKIRSIVNNFPGAIYEFRKEITGEYRFTYLSPHGFEIYEVSANEYLEDPNILLNMVHPEDAADLQQRIKSSEETMEIFSWTGRIVTRAGKVKWIEGKSTPHVHIDGTIIWNGILLDSTKTKLLENRLKEKQALESHDARLTFIGEVAAGIGHEIKNPLTIANYQVERIERVLQTKAEAPAEVFTCIEKYKNASSRILKIVQGLNILSRKNSAEFTNIDAKVVVLQVVNFLKEIYKKESIQVHFAFDESDAFILGDDGWLTQCMINLFSNAKDAVESTERKEILVKVEIDQQNKTVILSVKDSGCGIPKNILDKIFDPFFTTKLAGKGTGIGLSTTLELTKQMQGRIEVNSSDQGTEFQLLFPLFKKQKTA